MLTAVPVDVDGKSVDCHRIGTPYALMPPVAVAVLVVDDKIIGAVVRLLISVHPSVL